MADIRTHGSISRLVEDRGFGFIHGEDEQDYFFHQSDLENCSIRELAIGERVSFVEKDTPKGLRAETVTRVRQ